MKLNAIIKDGYITNQYNLSDGAYEMTLKKRGDSKTYEQVKKLWATIDDISRAENGDISQSMSIYLKILQMAGVRTDKVLIPYDAVNSLKKKVKSLEIVSRETINHQDYALVNLCLSGISDMTKYEVANVIEVAIRWASELGIETDLKGVGNEN